MKHVGYKLPPSISTSPTKRKLLTESKFSLILSSHSWSGLPGASSVNFPERTGGDAICISTPISDFMNRICYDLKNLITRDQATCEKSQYRKIFRVYFISCPISSQPWTQAWNSLLIGMYDNVYVITRRSTVFRFFASLLKKLLNPWNLTAKDSYYGGGVSLR